MTKPPGAKSSAVNRRHRTRKGFRNPSPDAGVRSPWQVLRWALTRKRRGENPKPLPQQHYPASPVAPAQLRVLWIGHSSLLVETASGLRILLDPVFSRTCSPLAWAGPARFHPPGISLKQLPTVHAVLISHNHYDHLDRATIKRLLQQQPQPEIICPLGLAKWFQKLGAKRVVEMDWWRAHSLDDLQVTATQAQHWSRRHLLDTNRSLWCGYYLRPAAGPSLHFAGDSGYFSGYKTIAERLGPPDIAALPIGAYEPRWFMKVAHQDPEEAVQAYRDLAADHFMAIHHNTFRLTDEPPEEPALRLQAEWQRRGLPPAKLWVPNPGDYRDF